MSTQQDEFIPPTIEEFLEQFKPNSEQIKAVNKFQTVSTIIMATLEQYNKDYCYETDPVGLAMLKDMLIAFAEHERKII